MAGQSGVFRSGLAGECVLKGVGVMLRDAKPLQCCLIYLGMWLFLQDIRLACDKMEGSEIDGDGKRTPYHFEGFRRGSRDQAQLQPSDLAMSRASQIPGRGEMPPASLSAKNACLFSWICFMSRSVNRLPDSSRSRRCPPAVAKCWQ